MLMTRQARATLASVATPLSNVLGSEQPRPVMLLSREPRANSMDSGVFLLSTGAAARIVVGLRRPSLWCRFKGWIAPLGPGPVLQRRSVKARIAILSTLRFLRTDGRPASDIIA